MRKSLATITTAFVLASAGCSTPQANVRYVDEAEMRRIRDERTASMSPSIEQKLTQWEPDHEDLTPAIRSMFRPETDVTGEWTTFVHLDGSTLTFHRGESGRYAVDFSTGGCFGDWDLKREAMYSGGVIRLSKPVEEYRPDTYDTLYAVSVDGTDYLISQSAIRFVVQHYSKKGVVNWSDEIKFAAFHRKDKAQPDGAANAAPPHR